MVADAADGTQEVFLKAFRGIRSFRQGSSLKTWLYRIAIREALNHKRWFKRHLQKNVSIDAEPEEGHARSKSKTWPPHHSSNSQPTKFRQPCKTPYNTFPKFSAAP